MKWAFCALVLGRTCSGYWWTHMCLPSSKMDPSKSVNYGVSVILFIHALISIWLRTHLYITNKTWHSSCMCNGAILLIVWRKSFNVFKSLNMTYWPGCESVVYFLGVVWWLCGCLLTFDSHSWVLTWKLLFRQHWAGDTQHRVKCFQVTWVCKLCWNSLFEWCRKNRVGNKSKEWCFLLYLGAVEVFKSLPKAKNTPWYHWVLPDG